MDKQNNRGLSWVGVAAMYIGVIMGAGFASGRECWQFFGVFGHKGIYGTFTVMIMFIIVSCMLTYVSLSRNTTDIGRVICPVDNKKLTNALGVLLAVVYYTMIIAMSAAGGSLLSQQFGIDRRIGGALIALLILITVLGDFSRLSGIFKYIEPLLITLSIAVIIAVLLDPDIRQSGVTSGFEISGMTPNWFIGGLLFISYNSLGMITVAADASLHAKSRRAAFTGAITASILLGLLTVLLLLALQKDMAFSDSLDMPMLGYSMKLNKGLNILYALVLCGGVYSTGSGTYYAFSQKVPEGRYRKLILVIGAALGYLLGLTGFKKLVEYLYPLQGYLGLIVIALLACTCITEARKKRSRSINN